MAIGKKRAILMLIVTTVGLVVHVSQLLFFKGSGVSAALGFIAFPLALFDERYSNIGRVTKDERDILIEQKSYKTACNGVIVYVLLVASASKRIYGNSGIPANMVMSFAAISILIGIIVRSCAILYHYSRAS